MSITVRAFMPLIRLSPGAQPSCLEPTSRRQPSSLTPSTSPTSRPTTSPTGQRWSTWDDIGILAGPEPWPDWVITADAAIDTELGILKTGKEADVFLLERGHRQASVIMAAKRYRGIDHRMFHRDSGYTEGRRIRRSRDRRAAGQGHALGSAGPGRRSGRWPSSATSPICGRPGCRCPTRCSSTGPSC